MSSMREPIHPGHVPNKLRAESRFVKRFWEKHYNFKCDKVPQKLKVGDVFKFWEVCNPNTGVDFLRFHDLTSK